MTRTVHCVKLEEDLVGHETLEEQCEAFLFGDGGTMPPDYVPEKH